MVPGVLVGIAVVALIATLVALDRTGLLVGPGSNGFLIRSRTNGLIDIRGRVPRSKVLEIKEFCTQDLASDRPFTIRGNWGAGKILTLRYTGGLNPAQQQRARNFLIQCLD
ncbi:hypothetical protein V5E97_29965 [Singulisphaera sp. Ch08]|uniref:PH domain-containing protein n=1 Tax=Singulisphaera sp. Ch08 TaxID=3120278 RepID=A0AAU7CAT3_9BACT